MTMSTSRMGCTLNASEGNGINESKKMIPGTINRNTEDPTKYPIR